MGKGHHFTLKSFMDKDRPGWLGKLAQPRQGGGLNFFLSIFPLDSQGRHSGRQVTLTCSQAIHPVSVCLHFSPNFLLPLLCFSQTRLQDTEAEFEWCLSSRVRGIGIKNQMVVSCLYSYSFIIFFRSAETKKHLSSVFSRALGSFVNNRNPQIPWFQ